jgi:methylated-DNA-[protein]-cysteine S-methyltransferase
MSMDISIESLKRELRTDPDRGASDAKANASRLTANAAAEGLIDVAYATADSPVGPVLLAATPRGLVRVAFASEGQDDVLTELARHLSPRVLESPAALDEPRRELEEYFEQRRKRFDLPLDWRLSHGFRRDALKQLARVPYGSTVTYSELAIRAGRPRAQRAAGSACGSNPIPIVVPCHRVVRTGGAIGNYGGGPEIKKFLLGLEGALGGLETERPTVE